MQEKQTKLWHTVFYENELKLKQLYVKICCNLPAHGCRIYRVKQLLQEGNANNKVDVEIHTDSILTAFCYLKLNEILTKIRV